MSPIDLTQLQIVYNKLHTQGVKYGWGAKAPSLDAQCSEIKRLDCSGFVQFAIAKASDQKVILPEGSVQQHDWCKTQNLYKLAGYDNLLYTIKDPFRLFIAFIVPSNHPGHVWLEYMGKTLESHGGVGVDSRKWNTPVLYNNAIADNASAVYELPLRKDMSI